MPGKKKQKRQNTKIQSKKIENKENIKKENSKKEMDLGDRNKTHTPNFAVEKEQPNMAMDEAIDKVFETIGKSRKRIVALLAKLFAIVKLLYLKVKTLFLTIGNGIGNVYYKISLKWAKISKQVSNTKTYKKIYRRISFARENLSRKERAFSDKVADFVTFLDTKIDYLENYLNVKFHEILWQVERGFHYAENNKKKVALYTTAGAALIISTTLVIGSMTAYEYLYNGKVLGVVKDQEDVYRTIDAIGDKLSSEHHAQINIDKKEDISFQKVFLVGKELDDKEDILSRLTYMRDMKVKGHAIYINGKQITILQDKQAAQKVLDNIKNKYVSKDSTHKYEKIGFAEKVSIKDVDTKLGKLQNKAEAMNYLLTGQKEKKVHQVQEGETLYNIAKLYGVKQKDLESSNPGITPEKIQIGQEIILTQNAPMLTVETQEVVTYSESVPYEIKYEDVNTKYKGDKTVKSEGLNGQREVVARIIKKNGTEIGKTELSSRVIAEPIPQVVLRGTKTLPPLVGTGSFIYPVRGTITSGYGSRWGSFHPALDIAVPTGTPVKASDGGKVVFAGYSGSYGYMVKINHGGNKVTLYAHCSKLLVKVGDRVYQGQQIAKSGSTGNSTGPHVHFEVQINGATQNPLNYL